MRIRQASNVTRKSFLYKWSNQSEINKLCQKIKSNNLKNSNLHKHLSKHFQIPTFNIILDRDLGYPNMLFDAYQNDTPCFVKAVAKRFNIELPGTADDIISQIQQSSQGWQVLSDGLAAAEKAPSGYLVLAGLRGDAQSPPSADGHMVVVVDGPLAQGKYPTAYWGRLGGGGAKGRTLNWGWRAQDRGRITYAATPMNTLAMK
jgi:hypothetical protein